MTNPSAAVGPNLNPDEEAWHQETLREIYLKQAEESVSGIEATLDGLKESLKAAKAEVKRLKDGGRV